MSMVNLTCDCMNHSLASDVDFAGSDNLRDVGWIIRFENCHLDSLSGEISSFLSEVNGDVVRGGVPIEEASDFIGTHGFLEDICLFRGQS